MKESNDAEGMGLDDKSALELEILHWPIELSHSFADTCDSLHSPPLAVSTVRFIHVAKILSCAKTIAHFQCQPSENTQPTHVHISQQKGVCLIPRSALGPFVFLRPCCVFRQRARFLSGQRQKLEKRERKVRIPTGWLWSILFCALFACAISLSFSLSHSYYLDLKFIGGKKKSFFEWFSVEDESVHQNNACMIEMLTLTERTKVHPYTTASPNGPPCTRVCGPTSSYLTANSLSFVHPKECAQRVPCFLISPVLMHITPFMLIPRSVPVAEVLIFSFLHCVSLRFLNFFFSELTDVHVPWILSVLKCKHSNFKG